MLTHPDAASEIRSLADRQMRELGDAIEAKTLTCAQR
jgi:hypothetical protein